MVSNILMSYLDGWSQFLDSLKRLNSEVNTGSYCWPLRSVALSGAPGKSPVLDRSDDTSSSRCS